MIQSGKSPIAIVPTLIFCFMFVLSACAPRQVEPSPTSKPATKEPMENLLKRARSAGLGVLLATQSPGDFDYKCRENINTWFVGKIKEDNITSRFRVQSIEPLGNQPWTYVAFGVKELHRIQQSIERTDRIVGRYTIRLIQERRSERNPSGLLLAEYKEEQMVGEKDSGLQQKSSLLDPQ